MNKITLSLAVINDASINSGQKILFRTSDYHDLMLLYDDGSDVAVWTKSEEEIFDSFPDAEKTDYKFILIGFGREYDIATVYKIPEFILSDTNGNKLIVRNFHMAVSERPDMAVGLVLPGNMFNNTITHIDRMNGKVHVDIEYDTECAKRTMGVKRKTLTQKEIKLLEDQGLKELETILSSTYCFYL